MGQRGDPKKRGGGGKGSSTGEQESSDGVMPGTTGQPLAHAFQASEMPKPPVHTRVKAGLGLNSGGVP